MSIVLRINDSVSSDDNTRSIIGHPSFNSSLAASNFLSKHGAISKQYISSYFFLVYTCAKFWY